jgi:hypothetical protein
MINPVARERCIHNATIARHRLTNDIVTRSARKEDSKPSHIFGCAYAREGDVLTHRFGMIASRFVHFGLEGTRSDAGDLNVVADQLCRQAAGEVDNSGF